MIREELNALIQRVGANWTEADRRLAADVVRDMAGLAARMAAGEDVSRDMVHVRAQALNIAGTEQLQTASAINQVFESVLDKVIERLLL